MDLPDRIIEEYHTTLRSVSEGAEKWLNRPVKCLDHGFVYLVDYMGNDQAIAQAARVSYGEGTKKINTNEGLIRYLLRHAHTTPFEMVEFKFHCKMPIFVARQWIRHRMASVNEYSGRYSEMLDEFYIPDISQIRSQSSGNRQGRGDELSSDQQQFILDVLKSEYVSQYDKYRKFLDLNLARELARIGLSVANYTQWYWKIDLHNLMHFLRLRLDSHAQHEIQVYGQSLGHIVQESVPIAYKAFLDYRVDSMTLSGPEINIIQKFAWPRTEEQTLASLTLYMNNKREKDEFVGKLKKLKLIQP